MDDQGKSKATAQDLLDGSEALKTATVAMTKTYEAQAEISTRYVESVVEMVGRMDILTAKIEQLINRLNDKGIGR